jgi:protein-disulfide isomerase
VQPTLDQVMEEYGDDVRLIFKNHPLPMHDRAEPAAKAALAAHMQGKFWEFHDKAFDNQRSLTDENFVQWAEEIGLDVEQFQEDMESDEVAEKLESDKALASELGVRGTPNFYINGQNIRGAQPFEKFKEIIEAEIEAMNELTEEGQSLSEAYAARLEENMSDSGNNNERAQRNRRPTPDPDDELFVPVGDSPVMGDEDALVTWVMFSEFQCPFCNRIKPTIDQLMEEYGDQLRLVFKHNPLPFHDRAEPAAKASIAAHKQGKFWEYHDILFENQRSLTDENLLKWAEELGLDMEQFEEDMNSEETAQQIEEDQQLARRVKARGTPHSFVNGMRVRGAQPAPAFKRVIDAQIEEAEAAIEEGASRDNIYETLQEDANKGEAKMVQPEGGNDNNRRRQAEQEKPDPVDIPIPDGVPSKGPADAPVTVVEYTDFECPFCSRFANNLDAAIEQVDGDVRVVVKQFPLPFHQQADLASQAALAAHAQGKFWEYHDLLFENQNALQRSNLEAYAEEIGLNMEQFNEALDNETYAEQVENELKEGQGFGVRGTPTWFINGVKYSGALPPARIAALIEEEMNSDDE